MFSRTYSAILVNTHCLRQQWVMLSFYTLTLIVLLFPTFVLARPDYSSSYLYISDDELMHQRDYTSMWTRTGIVGWIRTNHDLYSMPPTLNRICDSMIIGGSLQPVRMTLPAGVRINAPQVVFPTQATELRGLPVVVDGGCLRGGIPMAYGSMVLPQRCGDGGPEPLLRCMICRKQPVQLPGIQVPRSGFFAKASCGLTDKYLVKLESVLWAISV